jgi:hypothetical protein
MDNSIDQLDFFDEIESRDMQIAALWKEFTERICDLTAGSYLSDQTICANLLAWSAYALSSTHNDVGIALETEEFSSNSDIDSLKLAFETNSIGDWIAKNIDLDSDTVMWGNFEPIKHLLTRCDLASKLLSNICYYLETEKRLPTYIRQSNRSAFSSEIDSKIKIYYPVKEKEMERKNEFSRNLRKRSEYYRRQRQKELDSKLEQRQKKSEFGVGMFFGMIIGSFLTLALVFASMS